MRRLLWVLLLLAGAACGKGNAYDVPPTHHPDAKEPCKLVTCASAGATCGPVGDGCGDVLDCGSCSDGQQCGGDGSAFTCGAGCAPHTCSDAGATCGKVADGCGGLTADCGSCPTGQDCGAGGVPNQCGVKPCTGLCLQQNACTSTSKTTITGTVTAPGHADVAKFGAPDPIFGALVYVPNGSAGPPGYGVTAFPAGVACDTCSSLVTGAPLVSAVSAVDGTFTITDAPCGTNIPLVIQLGRWRREITIPSVACCATTALTNAQTHLPRRRAGEPGDLRSDIPAMAFSTGAVDTLHCVLRKVGIDDAEFTNPSGPGRVHLYQDNGAVIDGSTPAATSLYNSTTELDKYDMTLFECVGDEQPKSVAMQNHIIDYANLGGRVFATHFSYVWLDTDKPFSQTAAWGVDQGAADTATALVDTTAQGDPATQNRRVAFAAWLKLVGASVTLGKIDVDVVRHDVDAVSSAPATADGTPAQRWLFASGSPFSGTLQYTFDTPVAYAPQPLPQTRCGRVLYNDFHVTDANAAGVVFPSECTDGPMTPQEKTLEFLLFDLASCIGPQPTDCEAQSCSAQGIECGLAGDGCDDGVVLDCGACFNGQWCGGGGPGKCGTGPCVPRTCADVGANCGALGDGCGGTLDCGMCPSDQYCGGGDVPNQCGTIIL